MTFAEVQHKYGTEVAGTTITTTFTATPTPGSLLVAMGAASAASTLSISGWNALTAAGAGPVAQIFWKHAVTGDAAAVQMSSSASTNINLDLFELSGVVVPFAPTEMTSATGTAVTSLASNNLVTVRESSVALFAIALSANAGGAFAFTNSVTGGDTANGKMSGGYRLNVAAGTYTTTASWTTARNAAMAGAVFVTSGVRVGTREGIAVEVGFGSTWKTADAAIVWTDITTDVRMDSAITASRGRSSRRDQFETGSQSFTLNDRTRTYDNQYSSGPYYGQLIPGVPFRVLVAPYGQTVRHRARGFVTGWPQRYELGNTLSVVPVSGYGIFDKLARAKLPQSVVDVEVLADTPVAYWKLDDVAEAEMLDSSGNDRHGTYDNPTLQQDPLVADDGKAVFFDATGDHRGKATATLVSAFPFSIECWAKFPRDFSQPHILVAAMGDSSFSTEIALDVTHTSNPNGAVLLIVRPTLSTNRTALGTFTVDDDLTHHIVATFTAATTWALYIDGVADTLSVVAAGTPASSWSMPYWVLGNVLKILNIQYGLGGNLDNVAVYTSALSAARVLVHYNAGTAPWDGDTTDARLTRIAVDVVGLPADRCDFQACTTILGPTVLGQQRALDYMRLVANSEDGKLFETADGKVRFLDRYWGLTDTHATTVQVTFSDVATPSYVSLDIDPDDELLVNVATVTREGATALTRRNQTSVDTYGEADTSVSVLLQTDAEARSLGEHLVLVNGTPQPRVTALKVPLHACTAAQQASILDLDIGYLIHANRTPQGVGSAISLDLIIEGISETINSFEHWITFNVSVAPDTGNYFIWGTSTWDSTTVWGW